MGGEASYLPILYMLLPSLELTTLEKLNEKKYILSLGFILLTDGSRFISSYID